MSRSISSPRWWPQVVVVNVPKTTTILALGFLLGNFLMVPALAMIGAYIAEPYQEAVAQQVSLFKDGMLLILGFYFRGAMGGSDGQPRSG